MEKDKILGLAERAIKEYVRKGRQLVPDNELQEELSESRGVFVSLKKNGELRGCIGTVEPTQKNLAQEIVKNAVSAAGHDPRFSPVRPEEVSDLEISVDILGEPENVSGLEDLDPENYGVIVKKGHRSGLLLPDLDGVDTPEKQVDIACKKAGINWGPDVELKRFTVKRYQ